MAKVKGIEPNMLDSEIVRDCRAIITDLEFEIMPDDNRDYNYKPDASRVAAFAQSITRRLDFMVSRMEGTI